MTTRSATPLIGKLNAEWASLCASPGNAARVREWSACSQALAPCHDLDEVVALAATSGSDAVLRALLHLGHDGDALAHRTVFQMFLGAALRAGVTPTRMAMLTHDDSCQDAVDALWEAVVTYPLSRRPTKIAANLKMETVRRLSARLGEEVGTRAEVPVDPAAPGVFDGGRGEDDEPSARQDVLEVIAWGVDADVISHSDATLLVDVYCPVGSEEGPAAVAALRGLTAAAVRQRCSRAIRALSRAVHTSPSLP